ncbi:hypothetical protein TI03_06055, partial [Achromatium sp. WMS1]
MEYLKLHLVLWVGVLLLVNAYAQPINLDHIVAVINSDVITRTELNKELAMVVDQLQKRRVQLPP